MAAPVMNKALRISDADKRAALERELAFRRRCYPKWVAEGRMTRAQMAHQIAVIEAILDDYRVGGAKAPRGLF